MVLNDQSVSQILRQQPATVHAKNEIPSPLLLLLLFPEEQKYPHAPNQ
jgi:hypothetical protein